MNAAWGATGTMRLFGNADLTEKRQDYGHKPRKTRQRDNIQERDIAPKQAVFTARSRVAQFCVVPMPLEIPMVISTRTADSLCLTNHVTKL